MSVEQDLMPYVGQLGLANVPVWIDYLPYIHGLLYGLHRLGRDPKVFLKPFPKGPCRFPYVLLITIQFITFIPIDYSTLLCDVVLNLGATMRLQMASQTFCRCIYLQRNLKYTSH